MRVVIRTFCLALVFGLIAVAQVEAQTAPTPITVIKAGRLIDPETGTATTDQVIIIEGEKIKAIGSDLAIPAGATVIDLSKLTVLPGLVDAHTYWNVLFGFSLRVDGRRTNRGTNACTHSDRDKGWSAD